MKYFVNINDELCVKIYLLNIINNKIINIYPWTSTFTLHPAPEQGGGTASSSDTWYLFGDITSIKNNDLIICSFVSHLTFIGDVTTINTWSKYNGYNLNKRLIKNQKYMFVLLLTL